jgi:CRISPR system Cascade subunit CasC
MEKKQNVFVELHILQNFAPANLNRDDTGAPKGCVFGGVRRARISSQCLKRAIRTTFREQELLPDGNTGERTRLLAAELVRQLEAKGKPHDEAERVVEAAINATGLDLDKEKKTQYLVFLGRSEIARIAELCVKYWEELVKASEKAETAEKQKKKEKKEKGPGVSEDIKKALGAVLDGGRAADVALFGRMLADLPGKNIDAASQVAHAISTNKVDVEFDFYSAVDDLQPEESSGAGMMGTVEYNSACFYRYSNIDVVQLLKNLGDDKQLALRTVEAFLRSSVLAVPTGKQNSMAAQNPPSAVFAVVRRSGLWSLTNAFVRPVSADKTGDLVQNSIKALDSCWRQLVDVYGGGGILGKWYIGLGAGEITNLKSDDGTKDVDSLVKNVVKCVSEALEKGHE